MVDLYCLGVKNTTWRFNQGDADFKEFFNDINTDIPMKEASYNLVHNIIFAGLEYAEDLGFRPHKDFTDITEYFLEEDNDDIELMDIECGHDGKPLYIQGPHDTPAQTTAIIRQLTKLKGWDGFHFLLQAGKTVEERRYDDDDDFDDSEQDETLADTIGDFFRLSDIDLLDSSDEDLERLHEVTDELYIKLVSDSDYDRYVDLWTPESAMKISSGEFTHEMLGLDRNIPITEEDKKLLRRLNLKNKKVADAIEELESRWGSFAFAVFARLQFLTPQGSAKYRHNLADALRRYPGNATLQMEETAQQLLTNPEACDEISFENYFSGRDEITAYEMFRYQALKLKYYMDHKDFEALEAMYDQINDMPDIDGTLNAAITPLLFVARVALLKEVLVRMHDSIS